MKKWVVGMMGLVLALGLAACGEKEVSGDDSWKKSKSQKRLPLD